MEPIRIPISLDSTAYEAGLNRAVSATDAGMAKISASANQAATAAAAIGRAYSANATAFTEAARVQDELAAAQKRVAENYSTGARAYQAAALAFTQSSGAMTASANTLNSALTRSFNGFSQAATAANEVIEQIGGTITTASIALGAFGAAMMVPFALGVNEASKFEDAMVQVRRTLNAMGDAEAEEVFQGVAKGLRNISAESGAAINALAGIASEAARLGLRGEAEILKFTSSIEKIATVTGIAGPAVARSMANLAKSMDFPISEIDRLGSALVMIGRSSNASEEQILGLSQLLATAAKNAGFTTPQLLATTGAISSMGGVSSRAAMQFNMLLLKMSESVQTGDDFLVTFAKVVGMVDQSIKTGPDFARLFQQDAFRAMQLFFQGLVASGDRAQIALDKLGMGGGQATRIFLKFGQQIETLDKQLENANKGLEENIELTKQYALAQNTLTHILEGVGKAVEAGLADAYEDALPWIKAAADALHSVILWAREHPILLKLAAGATTAAGAFSLLGAAVGFTARSALSVVSEFGTITDALFTIKKSGLFTSFVDEAGVMKLSSFKRMLDGIGAGFKALGEAAVLAGGAIIRMGGAFLTGGFQAGFAALHPGGWIVLGLVAITAALVVLETKTGLVSQAFNNLIPIVKSVVSSLGEFVHGLYVIARDDVWGTIVKIAEETANLVGSAFDKVFGTLPGTAKRWLLEMGSTIIEWAQTQAPYLAKILYGAIAPFVDPVKFVYDYVVERSRAAGKATEQAARDAEAAAGGIAAAFGKVDARIGDSLGFGMTATKEELSKNEKELDVQSKTWIAKQQIQAKTILDTMTNQQMVAKAKIDLMMTTSTDNAVKSMSDQVRSQADASTAILTQREAIQMKLTLLDEEALAQDKAFAIQRGIAAQTGSQAQAELELSIAAAQAKRKVDRIALDKELAKLTQDETKAYADSLNAQIEMTEKAAEAIAAIRLDMFKQQVIVQRPEMSGLETIEQDMLDRQKQIADQMDVLIPGSEQYTAGLKAQAEAYALLTGQIDRYITKGLTASVDATNAARDAMGLEEWTLQYQKLTLAQLEYHTSYANLTALERERVDGLAQTRAAIAGNALEQERLKIVNDAYMVGLGELITMEAARQAQDTKRLEQRLSASLEILNTNLHAARRQEAVWAQIHQAMAQDQTQFYAFSLAAAREYANKLPTIFEGIARLIGAAFDGVQRTLSDVFFNMFTGKEFKLKDAFKDLMDSMLREIANFMAAQSVKAFLNFILNLQSGQSVGTAASNTLSGALGQGGGGQTGGAPPAGGGATSYLSTGGAATAIIGKALEAFGLKAPTTATPTGTIGYGTSGDAGSLWQGAPTSFGSSAVNQILTSGGAGGGFSYSGAPYTSPVFEAPSFNPSFDDFTTNDYGTMNFATGGHVPGSGRGDIVPAMLEPGEFVVRRSVAEQLGPVLEQLNGGGAPSVSDGRLNFATGGTVPAIGAGSTTDSLLTAILTATNKQTATAQVIAQNTGQTSLGVATIAKDTTGVNNVPPWIAPSGISGTPVSPQPSQQQQSEVDQFLRSGLLQSGLKATGTGANALGFQGAAQGAVGLAGLLSLYQGIQQGNPYMAVGGGLTAAQSLTGILSQKGVAEALGLTKDQAISLGIVSQGLGAATGAVGVVQGIQQGDYLQAGAGGAQTLGSLANIGANPKVAEFLGYGSGPLINKAGEFTPTLGGALGVAGGALGVVGGGLNIYQGIQTGSAYQIASGAYSAALGASTLSGAFGGPTIASLAAGIAPAATSAGTAASTGATVGLTTGISTGAALAGYIAVPAAIALGMWAHSEAVEASKTRSGILEGIDIRKKYAAAVPTILDAMQGVDKIAEIGQLPTDQQIGALLQLRAQLEAGWAGLPDVSHFIETKGVGTQQAISEIGRADTTQAELLAKLATPLLGAALARVYDSLAMRGYQVPGGGLTDIATIAHLVGGYAGAHTITKDLYGGQYADLLKGAAPGNYTSTLAALFTKANPQFAQSEFGQILQQLPGIAPPANVDVQAILAQQQAFRTQRQAAQAFIPIADPQAAMAAAPYIPGGLNTIYAATLENVKDYWSAPLSTHGDIAQLLTIDQMVRTLNDPSTNISIAGDSAGPGAGPGDGGGGAGGDGGGAGGDGGGAGGDGGGGGDGGAYARGGWVRQRFNTGVPQRLMTGGWISGGTPGRDSVKAMLEPGEFVVRRAVAEQMGPALEQLNGARGYALGGFVDEPMTRPDGMINLGRPNRPVAVAGSPYYSIAGSIFLGLGAPYMDAELLESMGVDRFNQYSLPLGGPAAANVMRWTPEGPVPFLAPPVTMPPPVGFIGTPDMFGDPSDPGHPINWQGPVPNSSQFSRAGFSMSGIRPDKAPTERQFQNPLAPMATARELAPPSAPRTQTSFQFPDITINIYGNVTNPKETASALVLPLRDELNRVEARFSRVGNKKQG